MAIFKFLNSKKDLIASASSLLIELIIKNLEGKKDIE